MITVLCETLQKKLATSLARGRSVRAWARRHDVAFDTAYECAMQNGTRELVDIARLRIVDRLVGKLLSAMNQALDQLVNLATRSRSDAIRLSASRTLLNYWVNISKNFHGLGQARGLEEWMAKIQKKVATAEWIPTSPYTTIVGSPKWEAQHMENHQ